MANNTTAQPFPISKTPVVVAVSGVGCAGVAGNLAVLLCQLKAPQLRNSLIATLAVTDLCASVHFSTTHLLYGQAWSIDQAACARYMAFGLGSVAASTLMTFFVGVDRFIAVWWPVQFNTLPKFYRGFGIVLSLLVYPWAIVWVTLRHATPDKVVPTCTPPTAVAGSLAFVFWTGSTAAINLLVILVYGMLQYALHKKHTQSEDQQRQLHGQLARSISLVVLLHILTWFMAMVIFAILALVSNVSPATAYHVGMYVGILAAINNANHGFVYLCRSQTYWEALLKALGVNGTVATKATDLTDRWAARSKTHPVAGQQTENDQMRPGIDAP